MEKGEETASGVFLGETMVDRDAPLSDEQLAALPPIYAERTPPSSPDVFRERGLAYVFDQDGTEVTVLVEDHAG